MSDFVPPQPVDVTFVNLHDRVTRMSCDPQIAEQVAEVRQEMAEADRAYAMGLAALRQAAHLTQVEVAQALGRSQGSISALESRDDMLLSTLSSYLEAIGGRLRLVVDFPGQTIEVEVGALRRPPAPVTSASRGAAPQE